MRAIDVDAMLEYLNLMYDKQDSMDDPYNVGVLGAINYIKHKAPTIDAVEVVRCKGCKHRPIKEDADGENYGFNLIEPTEGDERCPCLVSDGWYSWLPEDDFYCGYGEREGE